MKPDPEKVVELYVDADFAGGWNQEEGKDPGSFISIKGCVICYAKSPIICASKLKTEIALKTT